MTSGWRALHLADRPLPERERLGVRVVDAENAHALVDPEVEDALQLVPQRAPVARSRNRTDRCPGTSWAGSRRTGWCRRGACGTTRGARARTGGPGCTGRRCPARSRCRGAPPRSTSQREILQRAELRDAPPCARPRRAPMAQGLPGSSGSAVTALLRPLRWVAPIGWIGGRYSTSKPIAAMSGRRASHVAQACRARRAPARRSAGTARTRWNSARARDRPATGSPARGARCRSRLGIAGHQRGAAPGRSRLRTAARGSSAVSAMRDCPGFEPARIFAARALRRRSHERRSLRTNSTARSWPAALRLRKSRRQVSKWSTQASTV